MAFKKVVVLGGGPVGLLCAIEARKQFKDVTIVEKRTGYSRTNVPVLDDSIRNHMKKLGIHKTIGLGEQAMGSASFARIEQGLSDHARLKGVKVEQPYILTSVIGRSMSKYGRYKDMALFLAAWDDQRKTKDLTAPGKRLEADLLIIATGGAAAHDPVVLETLGFSFEKLKAKNYGAFGIFEGNQMVEDFDVTERNKGMKTAREVAGFWIRLETQDHRYLLTTLSGITRDDFKVLQSQTVKLKELLVTIDKAAQSSVIENLKEVQKNVGIFKIAIQRARQFYSPTFPAVMVGDAAVTPHPEKGSGYTTGFRGYEELKTLLEVLKKTDRSKDTSVAFQSFNDRYELHVSRKAIEGTFTVLANLKKMLKNYSADMRQYLTGLSSEGARQYIEIYAQTADKLALELEAQEKLAKAYYEYLKPDDGTVPPEFEWDETVGRLWEWISHTWTEVKTLTNGVSLMDERLARAKSALQVV